jgi:hypothetical protein
MATAQPQLIAALKQMFQSKRISRVAIIDDAYYESPTTSYFTGDKEAKLRTEISGWEEPTKEFLELGISLGSDDRLSDQDIEKIYSIKTTAKVIEGWFVDYDNNQKTKREQLSALEDLLTSDLGCELQRLSPESPLDQASLPDLIFIDYYLDPADRVEDSLELAETVGDRIEVAFSDREKPIVILMSSKPAVSAVSKSQFRDKARLIGGLFFFIPKAELRRDTGLIVTLAVLVGAIDQGRSIQGFVEAFESDFSAATEKFKRKIRALSIQDYAYMQQLGLHGEGMPLGDYLLWLFGTYFGHLLFRTVPKQRRELDEMIFVSIPESEGMPSSEFTDLYRSVVAEETPDLGTHPRLPNVEIENAPPDPHFGDLFVAANKQNVWMVITPECDLTYAPETKSERKFKPKHTVIFIPGKLEELDAAVGEAPLVTRFVPLGEMRLATNLGPFAEVNFGPPAEA